MSFVHPRRGVSGIRDHLHAGQTQQRAFQSTINRCLRTAPAAERIAAVSCEDGGPARSENDGAEGRIEAVQVEYVVLREPRGSCPKKSRPQVVAGAQSELDHRQADRSSGVGEASLGLMEDQRDAAAEAHLRLRKIVDQAADPAHGVGPEDVRDRKVTIAHGHGPQNGDAKPIIEYPTPWDSTNRR